LTRKPAFGVAVALLFLYAFHPANVYAEDVDAFRARVFKEVLLEVPDVELAKQILEIRLKRELIKQQTLTGNPSQKAELAPKLPNERQAPLDQTVEGASNHSTAVTTSITPKAADQVSGVFKVQSNKRANDIYVRVGNRVVVGYAYPMSNEFSVRADVAGLPEHEGNKLIDGNLFAITESKTSLGTYLDWFPNGGDFRFSLGMNANRIRTRLQSVQGTNANINGKAFNTGTEVMDITYKFPVFTPYLGLGYQSAASVNGWSVYADLGLMFGKYDAYARTSIVGMHKVTLADVDAELNILRTSLYKWSYVPVGAVGIKYRY
jgi:hypothetical protein